MRGKRVSNHSNLKTRAMVEISVEIVFFFKPSEHQSAHLPNRHRLTAACLDVDFLKSKQFISLSEICSLGRVCL